MPDNKVAYIIDSNGSEYNEKTVRKMPVDIRMIIKVFNLNFIYEPIT